MSLTPKVLAGLKETSRIVTTHYSTVIEGNRLTEREVRKVLKGQAIQGRERDETAITGWIEFFVSRMLYSFQRVQKHLQLQSTEKGQSKTINALDARQNKHWDCLKRANLLLLKIWKDYFSLQAGRLGSYFAKISTAGFCGGRRSVQKSAEIQIEQIIPSKILANSLFGALGNLRDWYRNTLHKTLEICGKSL